MNTKSFKSFDKRLLVGIGVFAVFNLSLALWKYSDENQTPKGEKPELGPVDTYIPAGFTLVPIQIENQEELGSLIDHFAIVDLYKKGTPKVIESGVRLLRSPRNPNVFAVLVEQDRAKDLISTYGAQFTVSLKNPDSKPFEEQKTSKRTIVLE